MQRLGAPSSPPPASCWRRKPQSMQAMAPGSRAEPQAGHAVGVVGALAATGAAGRGGAAGAVGAVGRAGPAVAPAATGSRAGAGPLIGNSRLQPGQRTCLPTALSGTCMALVQCGHRIVSGMLVLCC